MKYKWSVGHHFPYCLESFKVKLWFSLEFVSSVACTYSNRQGIDPCSFHEFNGLIRICVGSIRLAYTYSILNSSKSAKLCFNYYSSLMCILNYLLGDPYILLKGMV